MRSTQTTLEKVKLARFRRVWILGGAALLLVGVLVLQRRSVLRPPSPVSMSTKLGEALPIELGGVKGRDEAIDTTEEMKKTVTELLNYDDAVFRIYQLPRYRVSVYAAYWKPGKMSPRLVAGHTPDVCWPGSGWMRDVAAEREHTDLRKALANAGFLNGETRVFMARGRPEYVVFWHKIGPSIQNYGTDYAPPWWAMLDELWRNGLNLRQEQLFVRVSSDAPLEQVFRDRQLESLRAALLKLGLQRSVQ